MSRKEAVSPKKKAFIERFIEVCGSSQPTDIARLLDVSYQAAKNYLQGRLPDSSVLIVIAEKTPYSIHWLLTGKGKKFADINLTEDTEILTDRLRAFIRDECQKVVGEILSVTVEDVAQEKVIVLRSGDIKEEKLIK